MFDDGSVLISHNLSFAYGSNTVIRELNLSIPQRKFTALIGSNGCGKSTVLRALAGLMRPQQGHVHFAGKDIAKLSSRELARSIGFLTQGPVAPEGLSLRDLVRQGRYPHRGLFSRWTGTDEAACARALELTDTLALLDRPLESLSGGQRQRAWIAMILAQETDILLLDEPTTFLDIAHQLDVMALITDLVHNMGKTVVAVLHDLNQAARYANHMVMLRAGEVLAVGLPQHVMTSETIRMGFGIQARILPDPVSATPMCYPLMLQAGNRAAYPDENR